MNKCFKIISVTIATLTFIILGGCAGKPAAPTNSATGTPGTSPTPSIAYPTEPSPSPIALPASYYSTTDEIKPETEAAIFDYVSPENDPNNAGFSGRTSVDLDGDGKADAIQLLPGKLNADSSTEDAFELYDSITVKINGSTITVSAPKGRTIAEDSMNKGQIYGYITDMDANDGKKEIRIDDGNPDFPVSCLLTYDGKNIRQLPWLEDIIITNGMGYIWAYSWIGAGKLAQEDGMCIQRLMKLSADRSKWEDVKVKYYRTVGTYLPPIDEYTPIGASQWEQKLAKSPGSGEEVTVKEGTEIFLGFYDASGWIQVIQRDGMILGWLDCKKVDWDKYTGYVFAPNLE